MAKFRKEGGKETPAISTASLPDIVFMLLFFFMVSTTMREVLVMVDNGMPNVGIVQVQRGGAIRHTALSHYLFREIRQVQNRSRCVND